MAIERKENNRQRNSFLPEKWEGRLSRILPERWLRWLHLPIPIDCIVEGTFYDEWTQKYIATSRQLLPEDVTRVKSWTTMLTLVAIWEEDGIRSVNTADTQEGRLVELEADNQILSGGRLRTVITRDGRIYHDTELLSSDGNDTFLNGLIADLEKQYKQTNPATNIQNLDKLLSDSN